MRRSPERSADFPIGGLAGSICRVFSVSPPIQTEFRSALNCTYSPEKMPEMTTPPTNRTEPSSLMRMTGESGLMLYPKMKTDSKGGWAPLTLKVIQQRFQKSGASVRLTPEGIEQTIAQVRAEAE